jgi:hypothetical protein
MEHLIDLHILEIIPGQAWIIWLLSLGHMMELSHVLDPGT